MKIARIYIRVSTEEQSVERQSAIEQNARDAGFYIAAVYRETASGARADRPELQRMIRDLQVGEVVVAERMDRISRLPLEDAQKLIASIRAKGAKLAVPDVVDLSTLAQSVDGVPKLVMEAVQELLLNLALQLARDDYLLRQERQRQGIAIAKAAGIYKGRRPNTDDHARIIALRAGGTSIVKTAQLVGCSISQAKRVWRMRVAIAAPALEAPAGDTAG